MRSVKIMINMKNETQNFELSQNLNMKNSYPNHSNHSNSYWQVEVGVHIFVINTRRNDEFIAFR